jgi:serine/threonine protein kinase/uncharacterized protein YjdB
MTTCAECGRELAYDSRFCTHCGAKVGAEVAHPSADQFGRPSHGSISAGEQRLLDTLRQATLGEYEILGELGRGGMSVVFLAHEIALDRRVAIKVMAPALTLADPGIQERFKREARTAASLSYPHIIPVYAVKESEDLVYFVMKYIEGRSLESVVKEVGALPIPVVRTIVQQVGNAVGYAHRHGVVHRDLKPGNVMLERDGWVVVMDFGIARVATAEALTVTGGVVGTPVYMSPEQCAGHGITGAADQYSLGVMAYEMLSGRPPFHSTTMVRLLYDHCHTPPPHLSEFRRDCPEELVSAVMRMLAKDPADRWPTVEDAVAAIGEATQSQEEARSEMATLAQRPSTGALLDKFRTPLSPVPPSAPRARPTTAPAPAPVEGRRVTARLLWGLPLVVVIALVAWFAFGRGPASEPSPAVPAAGAPAVPPAAQRIVTTPAAAALAVGERTTLSAAIYGEGGVALDLPVTWETSDASVATVSPTGEVEARAAGTAHVTARASAASATVVVTVTRPPPVTPAGRGPVAVARLMLAPQSLTLPVGTAAQLVATVLDGSGRALGDRSITWASTDTVVATVTPGGQVNARGPGTARISAASEGQTAESLITVSPLPVTRVAIAPVALDLEVDESAALGVEVRDATGRVVPDAAVRWAAADSTIAAVQADGLVRGLRPGVTTVTAQADGVAGRASIRVRARAAPAEAEPGAPPAAEAIGVVLEQYRLAIESRSLARLRAAYPGMTSEQERAWSQFFGSVTSLRAAFDVQDLQITDDSAVMRVSATYTFRTDRERSQISDLSMRLVRTGGRWQLASIE